MRRVSSTCVLAGVLLAGVSQSLAQDAPSKASEGAMPTRSMVLHVPPSEAPNDQALKITAVVDAAWVETSLVVKYRPARSNQTYAESPFERSSAGGYFATVPDSAMRRPGVEYYIVGQLPNGEETLHFASPDAPQLVAVHTTQQVRWAEEELRRLGGYRSDVDLSVQGHNFGNRYGLDDYFVRSELTWTHRLLVKTLYSISLGYGFIEGDTPESESFNAVSDSRGARYGFAEVKLRLSRSVWADGKVSMGVSRNGLIVGAGVGVTLGRPWRSNLNFGVEILDDMGPSAWFRLQWDTVPPLLMGATVYKTDLPGAELSGGSFIMYDVIYPVAPRVQVRANVSFGSRDGPGNFGAGAGTSFSF